MDPATMISLALSIWDLADRIWSASKTPPDPAGVAAADAHRLVREFLMIKSAALRERQLVDALPRIRDALSMVQRERPKDLQLRSAVHQDVAAAYQALGEVDLRERHLNDACDCIVSLLESEDHPTRRRSLIEQRDALYPLIENRRMKLSLD